jgi:hypothetical protein
MRDLTQNDLKKDTMNFSSDVKVILLTGGLGNQIFQYAFGLYLESEYQLKVKYSFHNTTSKKADKRSYALNHLYDVDECSSELLDRINNIKIFRFLIFKFTWFAKWFGVITEPNFKELSHDREVLNNYKYFIGYWQDSLYLNNNLEKLKTFKKSNLIFNKIKDEVFASKMEYVAIHLRRGDYLKLSGLYNIIGNDYYMKALTEIYSYTNNPKLLLFTEDVKEARQFAKELPFKLEIVKYNDLSDIDEFRLMTECDHYITANSTFSFLAAKLSKKENAIKITPMKWFVSTNENMIKDKEFLYL